MEQIFRDESCKVADKAQKAYKKKAITLTVGRSEDFSCQPLTRLPTGPKTKEFSRIHDNFGMSNESLPWSIGIPIGCIAHSHFMSSYVPGSRFEFLLNMYDTLAPKKCLSATVDAVAQARFAWEKGEPDFMEMARKSYSKALTETNLAISNPATALDDATLISVLLLSLFETIIWAGTGIPNNWIAHTRGALALVRLRGRKQFETPVGLQLFLQVTNILSVDSIRLHKRLPKDIVDLLNEVLRQRQDERPIYRLGSYTAEVTNLLADIADGNMTPNEVVSAISNMDVKYVAFMETLIPLWGYQSVVLDSDDPEVYGRLVHQYPRPNVALIWNSIRMTRILLNGVLHGYCSMIFSPSTAGTLARAKHNRTQMAIDICATVPYFLDPGSFSTASAATLFLPLSTVRGSSLVPQDVRDYAEQSLRRLGRKLHVPGAEMVASRRGIEPLEDGLQMFYLS